MAVPMTVKMPDPITAPMPSAVKETGPSVFRSECSGRSDSEISLSIDLVAKICRPSEKLLKRGFLPRNSRWVRLPRTRCRARSFTSYRFA